MDRSAYTKIKGNFNIKLQICKLSLENIEQTVKETQSLLEMREAQSNES
jgi:hypothetical protein